MAITISGTRAGGGTATQEMVTNDPVLKALEEQARQILIDKQKAAADEAEKERLRVLKVHVDRAEAARLAEIEKEAAAKAAAEPKALPAPVVKEPLKKEVAPPPVDTKEKNRLAFLAQAQAKAERGEFNPNDYAAYRYWTGSGIAYLSNNDVRDLGNTSANAKAQADVAAGTFNPNDHSRYYNKLPWAKIQEYTKASEDTKAAAEQAQRDEVARQQEEAARQEAAKVAAAKAAEDKRKADEAAVAQKERDRIAAEQAAAKQEAERVAAAKAAEEKRKADEAAAAQKERDRIAAEQAAAAKQEAERVAAAKKAEAIRQAEIARKAEEVRLAEQKKIEADKRAKEAQDALRVEEARKAEAAKIAAAAKAAELKKLEEQQRLAAEQEAKRVEAARVAEEKRKAEAKRLADAARLAEQKRIEEEQKAKAQQEAERVAAAKAAEDKRKADEAAAAQRQRDEIARQQKEKAEQDARRVAEAKAAEEKRKADEAAAQKERDRIAAEQAAAKQEAERVEAARLAEEARKEKAARDAEAAAQAEYARQAKEAEAERKRQQAEAARLERERQAEEAKKAAAEAAAKKAAADKAAAEAAAKAEADAARKAQLEAAAKAADEERLRKEEEARKAEDDRKRREIEAAAAKAKQEAAAVEAARIAEAQKKAAADAAKRAAEAEAARVAAAAEAKAKEAQRVAAEAAAAKATQDAADVEAARVAEVARKAEEAKKKQAEAQAEYARIAAAQEAAKKAAEEAAQKERDRIAQEQELAKAKETAKAEEPLKKAVVPIPTPEQGAELLKKKEEGPPVSVQPDAGQPERATIPAGENIPGAGAAPALPVDSFAPAPPIDQPLIPPGFDIPGAGAGAVAPVKTLQAQPPHVNANNNTSTAKIPAGVDIPGAGAGAVAPVKTLLDQDVLPGLPPGTTPITGNGPPGGSGEWVTSNEPNTQIPVENPDAAEIPSLVTPSTEETMSTTLGGNGAAAVDELFPPPDEPTTPPAGTGLDPKMVNSLRSQGLNDVELDQATRIFLQGIVNGQSGFDRMMGYVDGLGKGTNDVHNVDNVNGSANVPFLPGDPGVNVPGHGTAGTVVNTATATTPPPAPVYETPDAGANIPGAGTPGTVVNTATSTPPAEEVPQGVTGDPLLESAIEGLRGQGFSEEEIAEINAAYQAGGQADYFAKLNEIEERRGNAPGTTTVLNEATTTHLEEVGLTEEEIITVSNVKANGGTDDEVWAKVDEIVSTKGLATPTVPVPPGADIPGAGAGAVIPEENLPPAEPPPVDETALFEAGEAILKKAFDEGGFSEFFTQADELGEMIGKLEGLTADMDPAALADEIYDMVVKAFDEAEDGEKFDEFFKMMDVITAKVDSFGEQTPQDIATINERIDELNAENKKIYAGFQKGLADAEEKNSVERSELRGSIEAALKKVTEDLGFDPTEERKARREQIDRDFQESAEALARQFGLDFSGATKPTNWSGAAKRQFSLLHAEKLRQYSGLEAELSSRFQAAKEESARILIAAVTGVGGLEVQEGNLAEAIREFDITTSEGKRQFDELLTQRSDEFAKTYALDAAGVKQAWAKITGQVSTAATDITADALGITNIQPHSGDPLMSPEAGAVREAWEAVTGQPIDNTDLRTLLSGGTVRMNTAMTLEAQGLREEQRQYDANLANRIREFTKQFGLDESQTEAVVRQINQGIVNDTRRLSAEVGQAWAAITGRTGTETGLMNASDLGVDVSGLTVLAGAPLSMLDDTPEVKSIREGFEAMVGRKATNAEVEGIIKGESITVEGMPTLEARKVAATITQQNLERLAKYDAIAEENGLDRDKFNEAVEQADRAWNLSTLNVAEIVGIDANNFRLLKNTYDNEIIRGKSPAEAMRTVRPYLQQYDMQESGFLEANDLFDVQYGNQRNAIARANEIQEDTFERAKTQANLAEEQMQKVWGSLLASREQVEETIRTRANPELHQALTQLTAMPFTNLDDASFSERGLAVKGQVEDATGFIFTEEGWANYVSAFEGSIGTADEGIIRNVKVIPQDWLNNFGPNKLATTLALINGGNISPERQGLSGLQQFGLGIGKIAAELLPYAFDRASNDNKGTG